MVVSHLVVEKGGIFWKEGSILGAPLYVKEGIFWEGGVDCGSVTYIFVKKGGILFWEGGRVYSGSATYRCRFWEGRISKGGRYFVREGRITGVLRVVVEKGGLFWKG